jgi:hypothetical protein
MIQWKDIEKVTETLENGKKVILVDVWHSPNYKVIINFKESQDIKGKTVYLGNFDKYDPQPDSSWKVKYEKLQRQMKSLNDHCRSQKKILDKIMDALIDDIF